MTTRQQNGPPAHGMMYASTLDIVQGLRVAFSVLRDNRELMEDLIRRAETGTGEDTPGQPSMDVRLKDRQRAIFAELMNPENPEHLVIGTGPPGGGEDVHLPYIGVLPKQSDEDVQGATCANIWAHHDTPNSTEPDPDDTSTWGGTRETLISTDEQASVDIAIWCVQIETAMLLAEAVQLLALYTTGALHAANVWDHTTKLTGMEPSAAMEPRVSWVPVVEMSFKWRRQLRIHETIRTGYTLAEGEFGT